MAFKKVENLETDKTVQLGGKNEKGQANPTQLEGYYLGYKEVDGEFGPSRLHIFQTAEGNVGIWGKTRLNAKLTNNLLGFMLLVTFTGMIAPKKKGRKPSYGYEVQYDDENVIDVSGLTESAGDNTAYAEDTDEAVEAADQHDMLEEETDPGEEEAMPDEVQPKRATPPRQVAQGPAPEAKKKVQDLLNGRRRQA